VLKIHTYPDTILNTVCEPVAEVTEEIQTLSYEMAETMYEEHGIGIAAPQVGRNLRIFVVDVNWPRTGERNPMVFINPSVESLGEATARTREGCLSLPGVHEYITRHETVRVSALGVDGLPFTIEVQGLAAVCVQHENDHLDGVTMLDRIGSTARRLLMKKFRS